MKTTLGILKALSDRNRLRIVAALSRYEELCACQITELLQVTGATVSRHLSILQHAGLLSSRKEGRWIYYQLVYPEGSDAVFTWLGATFAGSMEIQADSEVLDKIASIDREELCRSQRGEICCPK